MSKERYDVIIVGAGIVGLATAKRILDRHPTLSLAVIEKERDVALHQTSHNSGVIHAGLYYKPGSLKARLSSEGRDAMKRFARENGVPFEECGKVVVALTEDELPGLQAIYERATANGVPDISLIGQDRLKEIEPHANGIRAIHSPRTSIISYAAVARALAENIRSRGAEVILNAMVRRHRHTGDGVHLETARGPFEARFLITCTGLQTDRVVERGKDDEDVRIVPFRGSYHLLRPERTHLVRGLIYPVPDPRLPFLGVHFTKRVTDGAIMVGPNAIFAFAREVYGRRGFDARDFWDLLTWPGSWGVARRFWQNGLWQIYHDFSVGASLRDARRYLPELRRGDLVPGPTGIRAQTVTRKGRLTDDFLFSEQPHALHVLNAPSPAATASLAIAGHIVSHVDGELEELTTKQYGGALASP